jgi:hypothetical protein
MTQKTNIELSNRFIEAIGNSPGDIKELLIAELKQNESEIETMLSGYYYEDRGQVYGVNIDEDTIELDNSIGSFNVDFSINYYMGCKDLNYDDDDEMLIEFKVNLSSKNLELTGENKPEREPDEFQYSTMAIITGQKAPNYKHIFESLQVLSELHKDHFVVLDKPESRLDKVLANFKKNEERGFSLEFEDLSHHIDLGLATDIRVQTPRFLLRLPKIYVGLISTPNVSASVSEFMTDGFDSKDSYYYRLFIPLKKKIDFHFYIEHIGFKTKSYVSISCTRITYKLLNIDLYIHHEKEADFYYLILDASQSLGLELFQDYCFSTLVSFGFITGKLPQDEGYFFAYEKPDLKTPTHIHYTEFRQSLMSMYSPIYSNSHGYIRDKKLAKQVYPTLRNLKTNEFSKLCQWAFDSVEFSSILLLIIESSTSSLLVMPSGYSIALEGLTNLIVGQNEEKLAPIKNKSSAKKIRDQLKEVIDLNKGDISHDGISILKNKIDNINQLTNQSKLIKPFELLKFKLSPEDLIAIEHRNDFLHGRITLFEGDLDKSNLQIFYVSTRLYTLLSVLILKSIGYDNKIVNYPKINEAYFKKTIEEDHFRQV